MRVVDLAPSALVAGGDALARDAGGRVVFVEGALAGERVRAEVVDERRDFARARTVEVVEASPDRVAPPCPARLAGCGGCGWMHVAPEAQPRLKAGIVADALRRIGGVADVPITAVPVGPGARRTTVKVAVRRGRAAYHRHRSGDVVVVDGCQAVAPRLEEILVAGGFGSAREAVVRVGLASGDAAALLAPSAGGADLDAGVFVVGARDRRRAAVVEEVCGQPFRVSIRSFFQPGPVVAAALVDAVDAAVGDAAGAGDLVVDAYAGVGLLGAVLAARRGVRVVAVESSAAAVADARANLAATGGQVVAAQVGDWALDPADGVPAAVVADPARPGLGRPGAAAVAATGTPLVVLVSCDPASLGRDAALLAGAGFRLERVAVVDAFRSTPHVESVARFVR